MNFHIHLSVANALEKVIEEEFSIKLNKSAFLYGSIKPDLFPNVITAAHEIKYSKQFIEDEINCLLEKGIADAKCSWDFSEKLGIVMHYLTDFFCYVHSEFYKGSMWYHYLYEFKHSKYFIKSFKTIIKNIRKTDNTLLNLNCFSLYLDNQYKAYTSKSPSAARDLIYSLKICSTVSLSIIATALSNEFHDNKIKKKSILLRSA